MAEDSGLVKRLSTVAADATSKIVGSAQAAVSSVQTAIQGDKKEDFTVVDVEAKGTAPSSVPPPEEEPLEKVKRKSLEYAKKAAVWTEANVKPKVDDTVAKAKEVSAEMMAQLKDEGIMSKDIMMDAKDASKDCMMVVDKKFYYSSAIGDLPLLNKIPNVATYIDLTPHVQKSFIFWNAICLGFGYLDVTLYAFIHFMLDASNTFLYFPMYVLKLAFDIAVCTFVAYTIYFIFIKSGSKVAKLAGMSFIAYVAIKSLIVGLATCSAPGAILCMANGDSVTGFIQFFAFIANTVLLLRAYKVYKEAPPASEPTEPYTQLKDEGKGEEEAVLVPPTKSKELVE